MQMLTIDIEHVGSIEFELLYGQKILGEAIHPMMATEGLIVKIPGTDVLWNLAVLGNHIGIGRMSEGLLESFETVKVGDELTWKDGMIPGFTTYKTTVEEGSKSINMDQPIIGTFMGVESMFLMDDVIATLMDDAIATLK